MTMNFIKSLVKRKNASAPTSDTDSQSLPSPEPKAQTVDILSPPPRRLFTRRGNLLIKISNVVPDKMNRDDWKLTDYSHLEQLYKNNNNTIVYSAICKASQNSVVIKAFKNTTLYDKEYNNHIKREIDIHSNLYHPNITQFYSAFTDTKSIYMVMEYRCLYDLRTFMTHYNMNRFPENIVRKVILPQILSALQYLHDKNICHRDIKMENVLMSESFLVQICDFGVSIDLSQEPAVSHCGTNMYMAPEVLQCPLKAHRDDNKNKHILHYDYKVDIWSVGILTYRLMAGFEPYIDINSYKPLAYPKNLSREAIDFISACLHRCPSLRPTCQQLLSSTWLR